MDLDAKTIREEFCSCAELRKLRRGNAIFCEEGKGKDAPSSIEFFMIKCGEVCIATDFYSTGHINYDSEVCTEKMRTCPYREMNGMQIPEE